MRGWGEMLVALIDYLWIKARIIGGRRLAYAAIGIYAALKFSEWSRPLGAQPIWFWGVLFCADRAYFGEEQKP